MPVGTPKEGAKTPGVCVHEPCTCASETDMYCSEACRAADTADDKDPNPSDCNCGHPDCGAAA